MRTVATAFSPCSITGFFQIHDRSLDPLRVGSTGATVTLDKGVTTRVEIRKAQKTRVVETFNGIPLPTTSVTHFVARQLIRKDGRRLRVKISQDCELPMGCGYGTSGAGALSLSYAMNDAMGLSMSHIEAAQIAHAAEVAHKTGLGTVASAFTGGLTIRKVPGAPGKGRVLKIVPPSSLRLITASFGPISTKNLLEKSSFKNRVNRCSNELLAKMEQEKSSVNFLSLSRKFANCLGLMSRRLARSITSLDSLELSASMAMIGESLFSIVQRESIPAAMRTLKTQRLHSIVCSIPSLGARTL